MSTIVVIYIVMIVAAIAMLWANYQYKSKGVPWGRPLAGLFGIVAVAMAISALVYSSTHETSETNRIIERENHYTQISMEFLGDYLGDNFPDQSLVIISQASFTGDETRQKMISDSLTKGLAGRMKVAVESVGTDPSSQDPEMAMVGPEFMIKASQFNEIMEKHKDAKVFLSLVGLPMDFTEMKFWTMKDEERPHLALANANIFMLRKAIERNMVSVVLHHNPEAVYDPNMEFPKDPEAAFNQRFLLINEFNVAELATKYPDLFMAEETKKK